MTRLGTFLANILVEEFVLNLQMESIWLLQVSMIVYVECLCFENKARTSTKIFFRS